MRSPQGLSHSPLAFVTAGLAAVMTLAGCSSPSTAESAPTYLFAVTATTGTTNPLNTAPGEDERFTLVLDDLSLVTEFADRPFTDARVLSVASFVEQWDDWFADAPPNAVLAYTDPNAATIPQTIVATLREVNYNAQSDLLEFVAVRDYRTTEPSVTHAGWTRPVTPATFTHASLFIDTTQDTPDDDTTTAQTTTAQTPTAQASEMTPSPATTPADSPTASAASTSSASPTSSASGKPSSDWVVNGCTIAPETRCENADLSGEDLTGADLTGADLSGADLSGANLKEASVSGADLSNANLTNANLSNSGLINSDLNGADLSGANLTEANLTYANLTKAQLNGANLLAASLTYANLTKASLQSSDLSLAWLTGANVTGADFTGATLTAASWVDGHVCRTGSVGKCR